MLVDSTMVNLAGRFQSTVDPKIRVVHLHSQRTEALSKDALHHAEEILSTEERERCSRLHFRESRRDFIAAHALLRRSLSAYSPRHAPALWSFEAGPMGKPSLSRMSNANEPIEFNLSHTRGFVACSISSVRVGLDVERINPETQYLEIAEHFFHANEISALRTLPSHDGAIRFIELWTLKEALLKGLGLGISEELRETLFDIQDSGPVCIQAPGDVRPDSWKFAVLAPDKDLRLALAVESLEPPCVFQNGIEIQSVF
jgi:phosphopantetheine--protein transferase-like protein